MCTGVRRPVLIIIIVVSPSPPPCMPPPSSCSRLMSMALLVPLLAASFPCAQAQSGPFKHEQHVPGGALSLLAADRINHAQRLREGLHAVWCAGAAGLTSSSRTLLVSSSGASGSSIFRKRLFGRPITPAEVSAGPSDTPASSSPCAWLLATGWGIHACWRKAAVLVGQVRKGKREPMSSPAACRDHWSGLQP